MKVVYRERVLVLVPQSEEERLDLERWKSEHPEHLLLVAQQPGQLLLHDLGARSDVVLEPLNVTSRSKEPAARLISNFAPAPFVLDGQNFASVEGFWQSLRFSDEKDRKRVAALYASAAKHAGEEQPWGETVEYQGQRVPFGTPGHWAWMKRACRAKFTQNLAAREALLSTGNRPLQHKVIRDSRSIPGIVMAGIWSDLREELRGQTPRG